MIKIEKNNQSNFESLEKQFSNLSKIEILDFYEQYIEKHKKLNELYKFNEYFDFDYIFNQLDKCDNERKLSFIPFSIKDVFNTKTLPTSMGSPIWKDFKPGNNARVVDNIITNGGIIFSKTTTAEFAVHFITPGKTKNPHNTEHITGTSSSGSAVAVACGAVPVALGTQTAGSIIRPASFCGVYGFKPSFGAIDRTGVLKTNDTFDTVGLISSDLYGLQKTFKNIFQKGSDYPFSINFYKNFQEYNLKGNNLKICFFSNDLKVIKNFIDYVMIDFEEVIKSLSSLYKFHEIKKINFLNEIHLIHDNMYSKSLSYYFKNEIEEYNKVSPIMKEMIERGEKISIDHYLKISKSQSLLTHKMDEILKEIDFIFVPATATSAPKIGASEINDTCLIWSFFGYPSITLPLFRDSNNLPFGLQIIAKKHEDFSLLNFAGLLIEKFK